VSTYSEQFSIEHHGVSRLGEVITPEMQVTELVQVPDVQLVSLNVVVEVLGNQRQPQSESLLTAHQHN